MSQQITEMYAHEMHRFVSRRQPAAHQERTPSGERVTGSTRRTTISRRARWRRLVLALAD